MDIYELVVSFVSLRQSEKFRDAQRLVNMVNHMEKEIKDSLKEKGETEYYIEKEGSRYYVRYQAVNSKRVDTASLPASIKEKYTVPVKSYKLAEILIEGETSIEEEAQVKRSSKEKYPHPEKLNPEDTVIFERIKKWRLQASKDLEIQAFMILDNSTLKSLAYYKPKTKDDLLKIKGIGPEKLSRFGETLLELVNPPV